MTTSMSSKDSDLATYQNLVYGNNQLLLQQTKTLNIINNGYDFDSVMEPEPVQQKIAYSPFFVEIIHQKDKDIVYGYIRQKCQNNILIDIHKLILYYYCFGSYQYDGSIDDWTKEQLYGRYLPLKPIKCDEYKVVFEGKSTWYNKAKTIKFNTKLDITKIKSFNQNIRQSISLLRELKILRTLFGHPSIRKLYDVLTPNDVNNFDTLTVIYEHMDVDLKTIFTTNQYFSTLHVQYMLYHIFLGVKYMHDAGIIHKDLRPVNILINADCTVKISSLSHACGIGDRKHRWYRARRWYRAPETILLHSVSCCKHLYGVDIWSIGCIFAELLQMEKINCPDIYSRRPLLRGDSCFPLSPKHSKRNGAVYRSKEDQLCKIFKVIGCPNEGEMEWITDPRARSYVNDMKIAMQNTDIALGFNLIAPELYFVSGTENDGINLLKNLLQFDIRTRYSANDALKSAYFDIVRDVDLENISPPKMYEYQEIKKYDTKQTLQTDEFKKLLFEEMTNYA